MTSEINVSSCLYTLIQSLSGEWVKKNTHTRIGTPIAQVPSDSKRNTEGFIPPFFS